MGVRCKRRRSVRVWRDGGEGHLLTVTPGFQRVLYTSREQWETPCGATTCRAVCGWQYRREQRPQDWPVITDLQRRLHQNLLWAFSLPANLPLLPFPPLSDSTVYPFSQSPPGILHLFIPLSFDSHPSGYILENSIYLSLCIRPGLYPLLKRTVTRRSGVITNPWCKFKDARQS